MINILNKKAAKKFRKGEVNTFDGSYINKFDLALKNFEIFVKEETSRSYKKK